MNAKKIIISAIIMIVALFPQSIGRAVAQTTPDTTTNTTTNITAAVTQNPKKLVAQDTRVANLKQRADTEIARRVDSLTDINTKISTIKHITSTQKSTFTSAVSAEINNLNTLKTKIDADTDITTLRTDVKSIVDSYRVYVVFLPQLRMIVASDKILNITDTMNDFATKLASRIAAAENAGAATTDITSMQMLLTDMQQKISNAVVQANNVITTVSGLTPTGYPGNKTSLQSGRTMLQTARQDLTTAMQDAKKIIQDLKSLKTTNTTTSSTSPTLVPVSPTPSS